jgi:hypothetical protein
MRRRIAVVTVLVAVVALCAAAPALGFATTPPDGAYIWPWDGGSWGTVVDGEQTDVWNSPGTPIPPGTDVYIGSGWITYTRGLARNVPQYLLYKIAPADDPGSPLVTYAEGKTYWSVIYRDPTVDQTTYPAFNPRIGAKPYVRDWWCPMPGGEGDYEMTLFEKFTHTSTDLCGGYFDGQFHPVMYRAGVTEYPFVYTVE